MNRLTKNTMGMFDCLKGGIMIFVILAHCFTDVMNCNVGENPFEFRMMMNLPGLLMVMLFMCSGYGFKPIKNKKSLKNQFHLLIKPCLIVYLCCFLIRPFWNLLHGRFLFEGFLERVWGFVLGSVWYGDFLGVEVYSIQTLWFVVSLFLDWLLLSAVFRLKKEKHRCICVAGLTVIGLVCSELFTVIPFCLGQTFVTVGYVYAGYVIKKKNWCFAKLPSIAYGMMGAVAVFCLVFGDVNLGVYAFKLGILDYVGILFAAFLGLRLYLMVFNPEWNIYQPFMYLGRNSLLILFIHAFDHQTFAWRELPAMETEYYHLLIWVLFIFRFAMTVGILFGVQKFKTWRIQKKIARKGQRV